MKKKFLKTIVTMVMALGVAVCAMPVQIAHASSGIRCAYSATADYSQWELNGPIANKGWYIDPELGGERYCRDMRDAWYQVNGYPMHPILNRTTEPVDHSELGVYSYTDTLIAYLKANSVSEAKAFELIQNGYLAKNHNTLADSSFAERNRAIKMIISNGFCSEYIQQFKDMGYLDPAYELPAGYVNRSATSTTNAWTSFARSTPWYTGSY